MARKIIDIGVVGNDGTGDSIRDSFRKVNDNFRELYSSLGLGDKLTFIGLDDVPNSYVGQNDPSTGSTPLVTVNNTESGLAFKQLKPGSGISIDFTTNNSEIIINSDFAEIVADSSPQLGGDLSARSGGNQWRIRDLTTPVNSDEAVNKAYADTKISRAGVNAVDPATGNTNAAFGRMTGPLILSRDPEPDDDINYNGLIAASKRYVDNSAFGSVANLYVATSGQDDRPGVSPALQGRALAYAYRTLEAALRRAEELVLESRVEIGPYKKVLTYNGGENECTLSAINSSPTSGSGFEATALMSIDTVSINIPGSNYNVGDILTLVGGTVAVGGQPATFEVLTTATTPGAVVTFKVVSSGVYTSLPGTIEVATTVPSETSFGSGATFDITYKVNNVAIGNPGSGYSLVSVRITGGGTNSSAFGTAEVVGGQIIAITVTDQGNGFTSVPTVEADLPRFYIYTNGLRTDYTGDVESTSPQSFRGRDIREGLYIRGETSGALAQILAHSGELDGADELFDVDIKYGTFEIGETISYGDVTKNIQISVLVESGIYEENYPLKVPQNTSIVGDEFRRVIFRPRPGTSSSPWAFQKFRRDLTNDGLVTATGSEFGYHYLQDASLPVYPKIDNKGFYRAAAALISLNRVFIQEEVIAWINTQIETNTAPFQDFTYNENLCKRDVGLIVDSLIFDLRYGGYARTISAGLKYFQNASGRLAITEQLSQTLAGIERIRLTAQEVIANNLIADPEQILFSQIIDNAYIAETNTDTVIDDLILALTDVIDNSGSVNYPKENDQMDVFLANDAVRWQAITAQGHGGFMLTLDPQGQILAKSPYAQECASFSKSINAQTFAGGMFVDGFSGNLQFEILNKVSNTRLEIGNLDRIPNLPCSFIVQDVVYRVNYVRDFLYNANGSTATLVLDETTPWPFDVFTYDSAICSRDVGLIIDGLGYDIVLGTNFNARKAGLTYREANAEIVILDQKNITVRAIEYAHALASTEIEGYSTQQTAVASSRDTLSEIIDRGPVYAPLLSLPSPTGLSSVLENAKAQLIANMSFIKDEVIGYLSTTYPALDYDPLRCARDVQYIIEALTYDLIYGGNSQTVDAGLKYYDGVGDANTQQIPGGQLTETIAGVAHAKYVAKQVIVNADPAIVYSSTPRQTGSASDSGTQATIETLMTNITNIISGGVGSAPTKVYPSLTAYTYDTDAKDARVLLVAAKADIQASVVDFVDTNANLYELLMPGNRSMLANDFTQVNDLGYGIFATNSGLVEAVSMFTYYCHISYYSLKGAQIRSVGGSSAHGNYALVAEGSDPLEVPTPTGLYYDVAQAVVCYAPSAGYYNNAGDLFVYVTGYNYTPLGGSELEVDHSGAIYRYPVTSVVTESLPAGVVRLNLTSDSTGNFDGLFDQIADGVKMSLRLNSQIILTGELVDVAVRPSTGLRLREAADNIYRVLQFDALNDSNGNYPVSITATSPGNFELVETITTIASNTVTTSNNHGMKYGDKFIARTTGNGFISGASYYVVDVVSYTQFVCSQTPGGVSPTLTDGTGLSIKLAAAHHFLENYYVGFASTGTLPSPLVAGQRYYVSADGLSETAFRISEFKSGNSITITDAGSGNHSLITQGLTKTTLRENYNFVELVLYQPGEYAGTPVTCTITVGSPTVINKATHGLNAGDVIRFNSTLTLPSGLSEGRNYFVITAGLTSGQFRISEIPEGDALVTSGSSTGTVTYGLVTGRVGDTSFAVVPVSPSDRDRVNGMTFVFLGEEYIITSYQGESETLETFARVNLNRPLVDSLINYANAYTVKAAVTARTIDGTGSLTIRISLTRVTSHDLLEIGTGSYADTNYPSEIYGPAVNALNPTNETVERDVGRCFYVTTDQFGNFNVGPYFRVDQGTGRVTFSAAIALSNLDGIGFKRGVPIAEFSVDSGFSDNATDTVPTENATRIYIERRLGTTHAGQVVDPTQLIPAFTGGYMSLDGQLAMKGDLDLDFTNRIVNLADPVNPGDGVNLQSLTFTNLQEFTITDLAASDLLAFTGTGNNAINATVVGDVTLTINEGTNELNAQINSGVIINDDVKSDAAIAQSKLAMTAASTRGDAGGILQADLGLASFDSSQFTTTNGWVTLGPNGILVGKIQQIASKTVLGNSALATADVAPVSFASVVDLGLGVKKGQYSAGTGFLRRTSSSSFANDGDFGIVDMSSTYSGATDNSKLIVRDASGNFAANIAELSQLKIDTNLALDSGTTATGGYVKLYGFASQGGVLVGSGSLSADNVTYYDNTTHVFRTQNGLTNAPITASSLQVTAITTGGNTTAGTITGRWTLTGTSPNESRLQATYSADLAEYYEGDKDYEVGTVVIFGGDKEVTLTNREGDTRVAGVISNTAAFVMYDACPGLKNLVALQGRVPCKVVGKINKGDILVTSRIPGVAIAAGENVRAGTIVGKSLQNYDSDHVGTIEIAVGRT